MLYVLLSTTGYGIYTNGDAWVSGEVRDADVSGFRAQLDSCSLLNHQLLSAKLMMEAADVLILYDSSSFSRKQANIKSILEDIEMDICYHHYDKAKSITMASCGPT
ncbi:hypothetical protein JOQ06_021339 [Pogonophryne albipinna]|uniref:Uncharacterized protein n=1 Tax=Pogonophryne albipinna TaxID=1090488 RepID=A0AAD6ADP6_9TELE|nr:hypothetical protein JOQ06_021339 [Pogonophryne albipinna]